MKKYIKDNWPILLIGLAGALMAGLGKAFGS